MRSSAITRILLLTGLVIMLALDACGKTTPAEEPASSTEPSAPFGEYLKQGNEFSQNGQFAEAVDEYKKALDLEPENVDALTNLGVAYYNLGRLDDAIDQYSKAIDIAPNDADIHSNLAAAYVQEHQLTDSSDSLNDGLAEYEKATDLNPDLPEAHFGLGVVYALLGRVDDAIQAFERFQELDTGKDPMATNSAKEFLEELRSQ